MGSDPDTKVAATCSVFNDSNPDGLHYYHRATLTGLSELTKYNYYVSSSNIKSKVFSFRTLSSDPDWVPKFLIYGDLGHKGGEIAHELYTVLPSVRNQTNNGSVDLIFHVGGRQHFSLLPCHCSIRVCAILRNPKYQTLTLDRFCV